MGWQFMSGMARIAQELAALEARRNEIITGALEQARHLQAGDRDGAAELLEIALVVGRAEQAAHGQLGLLLGQVDRFEGHARRGEGVGGGASAPVG
jgi:hypothetical protein